MNKKIYEINICALGMCMVLGNTLIPMRNTYISYAQESKEVKNIYTNQVRNILIIGEMLKEYGLGETYNDSFASYLMHNGITKNEYKSYVDNTKKFKNSNVEKVYEIESLTLVFDQVVYTHPIVKSIYEQNEKIFKSKDLAWKNFKKGAVYDEKWMSSIFEESFEYADMVKVYKYLFKKNPTESIKKDLNSKETVKYGLYSGVKKKELSESERKKIETGKGYELLGVSKKEYDEYGEYLRLKDKIESKEIPYIKEYLVHENVGRKIKMEKGVDIYKEFTPRERLNIYNISLNNYNYDETLAEKSYKLLLMHKTENNRPIEDESGDGITAGGAINPIEKEEKPIIVEGDDIDEYEYIEQGSPSYGIFGEDNDVVKKKNNVLYTAQYYSSALKYSELALMESKEKFYVVKIGNEMFFSRIREENKVSNEMLLELLKTAFEDTSLWKIVTSQKEHLIFANNKIKLLRIKDEYKLNDLNNKLKDVDVKISVMTGEEIEALKNVKKDSGEEE